MSLGGRLVVVTIERSVRCRGVCGCLRTRAAPERLVIAYLERIPRAEWRVGPRRLSRCTRVFCRYQCRARMRTSAVATAFNSSRAVWRRGPRAEALPRRPWTRRRCPLPRRRARVRATHRSRTQRGRAGESGGTARAPRAKRSQVTATAWDPRPAPFDRRPSTAPRTRRCRAADGPDRQPRRSAPGGRRPLRHV